MTSSNFVNTLNVRIVRALFSILLAATWTLGSIVLAYADNPQTKTVPAADMKHPATPPQTDSQQSAQLDKITVNSMRETVETLQEVKVALHTQFSDNPKLVDQMVCDFGTNEAGHRAVPTLECGTQGWYSMQREATQLTMLPTGNGQWVGQAAVPTYGHPWHTVKYLNQVQLMHLRQLLKQLPAPGNGTVKLIDDKGKTITTIKADKKSKENDKI